MSDTITNAKEIYYSFRDEHGTRHVVPVRGVYVTGEWKPPLYMEPILRVIEFNTNSITIEDYIETEVDHEDMSSIHLYDVGADLSFNMTFFSTCIGGSFPEPVLRMIEFNTTASTIEDYNE